MQKLQIFILICIAVYALISVLPYIAIIKQNHAAIYKYIKDLKYGSQYAMWWYMFLVYNHNILPFYMDIPFSQYRLAIWVSGNTFASVRITLIFLILLSFFNFTASGLTISMKSLNILLK